MVTVCCMNYNSYSSYLLTPPSGLPVSASVMYHSGDTSSVMNNCGSLKNKMQKHG